MDNRQQKLYEFVKEAHESESLFIRNSIEHVLTGYLKHGYEIQLESSLLPFPEQDEE